MRRAENHQDQGSFSPHPILPLISVFLCLVSFILSGWLKPRPNTQPLASSESHPYSCKIRDKKAFSVQLRVNNQASSSSSQGLVSIRQENTYGRDLEGHPQPKKPQGNSPACIYKCIVLIERVCGEGGVAGQWVVWTSSLPGPQPRCQEVFPSVYNSMDLKRLIPPGPPWVSLRTISFRLRGSHYHL